MNKSHIKLARKFFLLLVTSGILISGIGLGTYWLLKKIPENPGSKIIQNIPKSQVSSLKIGVLTNPTKYETLADYLKKQLGNNILITIDGDENISFQEAKTRIATKQWDIAFTLSPMITVAAKDNGYTFAAQMFPNSSLYYQSALFVRSDSSIKSIEDLKSSTKIALGDFNSASSFYMPVYDLYGKTLNLNMGLRSHVIREMVKNRKVDIGAGAYSTVKNDPDIRIIHQSRNIPGAGVYLSPNLPLSDREIIATTLLKAPIDIQKDANFGQGKELDYSFFQKVTRRTEQVLSCSDFTKNPVSLFCSVKNSNSVYENNKNMSNIIVGKVNGWSRPNDTTILLNLSGDNNKFYRLFINEEILNQVPDAGNVLSLQNKQVQVNDVLPKNLSNNIVELNITHPNQLKIIEP
ncbi:phosphate/phosphite/phosphonate ABC transporter substrate-binding protein [Aulosira sp. FACHB-615]|uniref:phosphate/phosphite/phosphonate ABC transporter substrate-binding protein n=1 Tax=Aulosira sp. FACHB-615 TaxID=2692777 RepID=UPI0016861352|nr:PhnD/SsuA/transferrin family substrate-binding protein [Aulosira sp. FACHB-615]MBD2489670.1 PhnD/SsuA/transferrin family substrate-binding protein [Aulosira sp. FACHB-615]